MMIIRKLKWPDDREMLTKIDTSFQVERIYTLIRVNLSFSFQLRTVSKQYKKDYKLVESINELPSFDWVVVAVVDSIIVGLCAIKYESWNRRANLYHLYVAPDNRGQGIGRLLIDSAVTEAVRINARCMWVETQNNNSKAIDFYMHMGFAVCGFDSSLYDENPTVETETAVFLTKITA
jgi:ribosomal protein S18 acetylase RimI-like enzyme